MLLEKDREDSWKDRVMPQIHEEKDQPTYNKTKERYKGIYKGQKHEEET